MHYNGIQQLGNDISLALLTAGTAPTAFLYSLLSVEEKARFNLIELPKRKANWLRGRAVVKYLLLNSMQEKNLGFQNITKQNLQEFSPWMYQMVEVLPKDAERGSLPSIWLRGKSIPMNLSITHSSAYSSACIDIKNPVGIDLETTIVGTDIFYRGNYTATEIDWVRTTSQEDDINPDWLFTLLWTLKEATIKSRNTNDISVFEFPNLEIKINADNNELRQAYQNNTFGNQLQSFEFDIVGRDQQCQARAVFTATSSQILSAIKILI